MSEHTKVKVFKKGVEVGWFKDVVPGINTIVSACAVHGFDIADYEFRLFDDEKKVVWRGAEHQLDV